MLGKGAGRWDWYGMCGKGYGKGTNKLLRKTTDKLFTLMIPTMLQAEFRSGCAPPIDFVLPKSCDQRGERASCEHFG